MFWESGCPCLKQEENNGCLYMWVINVPPRMPGEGRDKIDNSCFLGKNSIIDLGTVRCSRLSGWLLRAPAVASICVFLCKLDLTICLFFCELDLMICVVLCKQAGNNACL